MKGYRFIVKGRVQGVWYRKSIYDASSRLGLKGYVRNLPNGDVEAVALLEEGGLYDYLALLKEGSLLSEVSDIDIYEYDGDIVSDFEIRY